MVWYRIGDKPLSEPMLNRFTDAYICGTSGDELKVPHTITTAKQCTTKLYAYCMEYAVGNIQK